MAKISPDEYFNKKVKDYFETYSEEITSRLENSRKKALTLEKIRKENEHKRVQLYKFSYKGEILSDSFRNNIIERFKEIYEEFVNQPVEIFINKILPVIRQENEADYQRYEGTNVKPLYDIDYLRNGTTKEIIDLVAHAYVLSQFWYQISDFLCEYYAKDEISLSRILYNEYIELESSYFKQQVDPDFPKLNINLNFDNNKKNKNLPGVTQRIEKAKEPFILNLDIEEQQAYLTRLHKLLLFHNLIEVEREAFIMHFTSNDFQKIVWKGKSVELVYFLKGIDVQNPHLHSTTCYHFLNSEGQELSRKNLSSIQAQMVSNYPLIDKILNEMKKKS